MSIAEHTAAEPAAPNRTAKPRSTLVRRLGIDRLSGVYCLALLIVLFALLIPETFLTASTVRSIGANSAVTSLVALALIVPVACGLFDLSVAGILGVAAVLVLDLQQRGLGAGTAVLLTLLAGAVIGAINGFLVVKVGVDSFIATLGISSVLAAGAFAVTDGNQLVAKAPSTFVSLGQGTLLGLPRPVWYAVAIAAVLYYVTERTTAGRYMYAIGGNIEASRLVGIRVDRVRFASLVTSGVLGALAGVVLSAQLGASSADIGPAYLLPAFSAVLLGATQIKTNGRANVLGTLVAVVLLATGIFGLQLAGAPTFISSLFNGVALILAVSLSLRANRQRA